MEKHCSNLVQFFNNAYDNYKSKRAKHNISNCIKKIHAYEVDEIKLKLPRQRSVEVEIKKDDKIHTPLSFILSNLDEEQFTDRRDNEYAFKALQLILNILEDQEEINNKVRRRKKLLSNIKMRKDFVNLMEFGEYKIVIPRKIELTFNVKGLDLATLKIKKLFRINKKQNNKKQNKSKRNTLE